jgi:hypothetical protein
MMSLTEQQKELIFDYCLGLTDEEESARAQQLIESSGQAAEIYSSIHTALTPLDSFQPEACPDQLVESTVWRLKNLARSSQLRLEQLLVAEQAKTPTAKPRFWRNFGEMLATAAAVVLVAGVLIPPLSFARQKSWQQQCQMQLSRVFQGLNNYTLDNEGALPAVASAAGEPWWKVGYQGKENHSNTRHVWLLAKNGYVDVSDFVCPGKREGKVIQFDQSQAAIYNDFPARRYVTYSFRVRPCQNGRDRLDGQKVLMSDLNPLFEKLPASYSQQLKVELNKVLAHVNSANHNRNGQNILLCNGSVRFTKTRDVGQLDDDIFTVKDTTVYKGCEVPTCESDAFLAP